MRILILIAMLTIGSVHAQMINANTEVFHSDDKSKVAFKVNKALEVYSQPKDKSGWFTVRMIVLVEKASVSEDDLLASESFLFDLDGEKIGATVEELTLLEKAKAQGRKNKNKWMAVVEGQVFKTKFVRGTVPEMTLENIFTSGKKGMMARQIDDYIDEHRLIREDVGEFSFYPIYRENHSLKRDKDFKILLVYKKGGSFYGIVTHDFALDISAKTIKEDDPIYMYFPVMKANDRDLNEIFELVFEFIAL